MEAGRRAGCRTELIDNGDETEWVLNPDRQPHYYAASIDEAARIILSAGDMPPPGLGPVAREATEVCS